MAIMEVFVLHVREDEVCSCNCNGIFGNGSREVLDM
jgi:hypothetical protein